MVVLPEPVTPITTTITGVRRATRRQFMLTSFITDGETWGRYRAGTGYHPVVLPQPQKKAIVGVIRDFHHESGDGPCLGHPGGHASPSGSPVHA